MAKFNNMNLDFIDDAIKGDFRARLVTKFSLERMGLGMGMELDSFGYMFKGKVMSNHCNVW